MLNRNHEMLRFGADEAGSYIRLCDARLAGADCSCRESLPPLSAHLICFP